MFRKPSGGYPRGQKPDRENSALGFIGIQWEDSGKSGVVLRVLKADDLNLLKQLYRPVE